MAEQTPDQSALTPAPMCICTGNWCDFDDHDNPLTGRECVVCACLPEASRCPAREGADDAADAAETEDGCQHCSPTHERPESRPWGVYVAPDRDGDGQPTHLVVQPSNGAHVAQSDADWLWQLIRDYRPDGSPPPAPDGPGEPQRGTGRWGRGA